MLPNNKQNFLGYFLTLVLAMSLKILPLPAIWNSMNPDWVLLILIYWTLAIPEKIGVFNAWLVGLLVDVLTGRVLGQYALIYALISYICLKLHKRLRQYPVPQQALFIFFCLLLSQILIFWVENIQGRTGITPLFWLPVITGTLLWPFVYTLLRFVRVFGQSGR